MQSLSEIVFQNSRNILQAPLSWAIVIFTLVTPWSMMIWIFVNVVSNIGCLEIFVAIGFYIHEFIKTRVKITATFPMGSINRYLHCDSGTLMAFGDVISQTTIEKTPISKLDSDRTSRFFLMGCVCVVSRICACMMTSWHGYAFRITGPLWRESGSWFNIKMASYQYRKSHCGDKTVVRSSYLHNGISYTGKMTSLYWISPQNPPWLVDSLTKGQ